MIKKTKKRWMEKNCQEIEEMSNTQKRILLVIINSNREF